MRILFFLLFPLLAWSSNDLPTLEAQIKLLPSGDFTAITHKIKGHALYLDGKLKATPIYVDLTSIKTGKDLRDEHLKDRLWTVKYPVASLRRMKFLGEGKGQGELFIRGSLHSIFFDFVEKDKNWIEARFILSLKQLGLEPISYLGLGVEDLVDIRVLLPLRHEVVVKKKNIKKKS